MRLERLSEMAAPVRLSRRNTPTAEVDESVLEAASHKEADDVNDRSREEVLRDVRSHTWHISVLLCVKTAVEETGHVPAA